MKYIDTLRIEDIKIDLGDAYQKREKSQKDFYGTDHNYENCIIIPPDINSGIKKINNNIFICNDNKDESTILINNIVSQASNDVYSKIMFQEVDLKEIEKNDCLFVMQTIKAFESFTANNVKPLCSLVTFNRLSDRYSVTIYLNSNEIDKIEKVFNDIL